jgi:hypothetical protein
VIAGFQKRVVVVWFKGQENGTQGATRLKYAVNKGVMDI